MKKIIALVLTLALALCCLAACSPTANTDSPDGTDAGKDDAKVIVVAYTLYEPMNYMDGDTLVGFDTELAEAVFANLGYKVRFQEIDWNNRYADLDSNTVDCVWNGFTCNVADEDDGIQRSEKVDFSYNYMENRQVIVVKKDSGIATAADLSGKKGAAEASSAGESYGKSFENVTIKPVTKQTDCLLELKSGNIDFAVFDAQLAKSYVGQGDYEDLMILEDLSSDVEYYAIGFKKGSDLTAKVNAELVKLAADGTIATLAEKYGVSNTAITDFSDQQ